MSERGIKQQPWWVAMKRFAVTACCASILSGCHLIGYYKYEKAVWVPPQEAQQVRYPDSFEDGIHIKGAMTVAVAVAMNDFFPPGKTVRTSDPNKRMADCLSRKDTYDISVLKANETLYFVRFIPFVSRCGINERILDGEAVYAIDGLGRIVGIQ
jgi:hypothetical protein